MCDERRRHGGAETPPSRRRERGDADDLGGVADRLVDTGRHRPVHVLRDHHHHRARRDPLPQARPVGGARGREGVPLGRAGLANRGPAVLERDGRDRHDRLEVGLVGSDPADRDPRRHRHLERTVEHEQRQLLDMEPGAARRRAHRGRRLDDPLERHGDAERSLPGHDRGDILGHDRRLEAQPRPGVEREGSCRHEQRERPDVLGPRPCPGHRVVVALEPLEQLTAIRGRHRYRFPAAPRITATCTRGSG